MSRADPTTEILKQALGARAGRRIRF